MEKQNYLLGRYKVLKQKNNTFFCMCKNNQREVEYNIYRISKERIDNISAINMKQFENLSHQNILNFQVEQDSSYYYFIREKKEGYSTISDNIPTNKNSLNGFFTCFIQICDALIYLHSKNIVHGCLSYSSIITNEDEEYFSYLLDIGYSYINILNEFNNFFAAPEQKDGSVQYSKEADIYSLAQIMLNVYKNTVAETETNIYIRQQLIDDMGVNKYENELLSLFITMIDSKPENRLTIIKIKQELEYIYKLYKNENDSYSTLIPIRFTPKADQKFQDLFEFKENNLNEKIVKIEELSKGRVLFKETDKNYIIILSDYVFLCSKNKGFENGYLLVVGFSKVTDRDYSETTPVTDVLFEYYNNNDKDYYDNPEEFIRNCSNKKIKNYNEMKDIKQEESLLRSIKNVINNKKIDYLSKVMNVNKVDNVIKLQVIDDEKFVIKDKKITADILKKYFNDDYNYDNLASFITTHIDELAQYAGIEENSNEIEKCKKICNLFEGAVDYKNSINMVLQQGDDIIISDDKGNEFEAKIKHYDNNKTELEVELNQELYKKFVKDDEYKLCYDYQIKEMIYNKQSQAFDDIKNGSSHIEGILKKISNPVKELVTYDRLNEIDNFFNTNLDYNQKEAVIKALNLQKDAEILLIHGPPGTGKTTVITEIVEQYLKKDSRAKILVTSQSNQAVDNVLEKVCDKYKVLRIGRDVSKMSVIAAKYRDEEILNTIITKNMNALKSVISNDYQKNYYEILANINDKETVKVNKKEEVNKKLQSDEVINYFLEPIQIIFATLIGISSWKNFKDVIFDLVIIDEAGRALFSELSVPIRKAKYIIFVGDQKQLAPVMDNEVIEDVGKNANKENYKEDLLNYNFFGNFCDRLKSNSNAYHFLEYNYRAHSTICDLYSNAFYDGLLKSNKEYDSLKNHGLSIYKCSVVLIDTSKSNKRFDKQAGTGKLNVYNAEIIREELKKILKDVYKNNLGIKTIGVITPYRAQKEYLIKYLREIIKEAKKDKILIDIGTVDSFQGNDRDYIIYDSVRSESKIANIEFISDEKRLNVSLSRAKELLIIIADSNFLSVVGKRNSKWSELINIIKNNPVNYEMIEMR